MKPSPGARDGNQPAPKVHAPGTPKRATVKEPEKPRGIVQKILLLLLGSPQVPNTKARGPDRAARPGRVSAWLPTVFVGTVWVLALIAAGVKGYLGLRTPQTDDWVIVDTVGQPLSWDWLWAQHGEGGNHRIPLPKLILRSLYQWSGYDCRWAIWFNALALGGAALALIWAARRARGRTIYSDAIFPLVVLHWLAGPLWWGFHVQFTSSTVLACILLALVVRYGTRLTTGAAWLAGLCLVALPLCGANGLALVPALAVWLGCAGLAAWCAPASRGKGRGLVLWGFVLAALALIVLYLRGYESQGDTTASHSLETAALALANFFSVDFSSLFLAYHLPPWMNYGRYLEVAVLLVSLPVLLYLWWERPDRSRAFGLLMFLGAFACLALGLALGRGGSWSDFHYRILAAPVLFAVYFIWEGVRGRYLPRVVQAGLCLVALVALPIGIWENFPPVWKQWQRQQALDRDILAGVPPFALADQYSDLFNYADNGDNKTFADNLAKLRDAHMGTFRHLRSDPAYQEVPVPRDAGADAAGSLLVDHALPGTPHVYAVRLKYVFGEPVPYTSARFVFRVSWEGGGRGKPAGESRSQDIDWDGYIDGPGKNFTVWINEDVSKISVTQELKPEFAGDPEVVLLVPAPTP